MLMAAARATWGAIPRRPGTGLRRLAQVPALVHSPMQASPKYDAAGESSERQWTSAPMTSTLVE